MSNQERLLNSMAPDVPECFHNAVMETLNTFAAEEAREKMIPMKPVRSMRRVVLVAALLAVLFCTAAYAAYRWDLFEEISFMTGAEPKNADMLMQHSLHQEIVNGVEITISEAGYDGRTMFIQYRYRILDADKPLGTPEDGGITREGSQMLAQTNVGWWIDHMWVDGQCLDMAANSGSVITGSDVPGEMICSDYWRLDNLDVELKGKVEVSLPIGERQPLEEYYRRTHPEKYTDDGQLMLPDKGVVTFTLDTGDMLDHVITESPNVYTEHPDVRVCVSEVAFTPLMTYITLDMEENEESLKAYIAKHGEGYYDDEGKLIFPYDGSDVYGSWISKLKLVDGEGKELFPGHYGNNGFGSKWAEFLYPYIETIPDALYLAPAENGRIDMTYAVKVR